MIGRDRDGRLLKLRKPDICDYVTAQYDERILPNEYTYSLMETSRARQRAQDLQNIIKLRKNHSAALARKLHQDEMSAQTKKILARRIPMTHW